MATKTIITTVTIHAPSDDHRPFKFDGAGSRVDGHYAPEHVLPGNPVTLDEKEADVILRRFGGQEVNADGSKKVVDAKAIQPPKVTTDPGKPGAAPTKV